MRNPCVEKIWRCFKVHVKERMSEETEVNCTGKCGQEQVCNLSCSGVVGSCKCVCACVRACMCVVV